MSGIKMSSGSGTIIASKEEGAYILTAAHVCVSPNPFEQTSVKKLGGDSFEAQIIRLNIHLDMCMLLAPGMKGTPATVSFTPPVKGEQVFSISSPYGLEDLDRHMVPIIRGTYSGKYQVDDSLTWDLYHLRIAPGSSGGMIVNRYGHVVGMTHRLFLLGRGAIPYYDLSVGVQHSELRDFVKSYL